MKIALILPRAGIYRYKTGAFSRFVRYAPLTLTTLASLVPEEISTDIHIYDEGIETVNKKDCRGPCWSHGNYRCLDAGLCVC